MVFIIIWNVTGELVSLKNMTIGLNSPLWVRNAAFTSSPSLIWMLLYPQWMSTIVNLVHLLRQSMTWGMRGIHFYFSLSICLWVSSLVLVRVFCLLLYEEEVGCIG